MIGGPLLDLEDVHPSVLVNSLNDLTYEERKIIEIALREHDCVNLPYAISMFTKLKQMANKTDRAIDMTVRRAAYRLYNRGLAALQKCDDGLVWVTIERERIHQLILNDRAKIVSPHNDNIYLIEVQCEIPTEQSGSVKSKNKQDKYATPANTSGQRLSAIRLVKGLKMLEASDKAEIDYKFELYNDDVSQKIIALIDRKSGEVIGSEYSTRFNDIRKAAIQLKKFDYSIEKSLRDYYHACFLTLTTDPKRFKNLWEANRHFSEAWDKFLSYLTKQRGGKRPQYITSFEYTKSGLMHCHAIIFLPWLVSVREISKEWVRCGQGEIVYIYKLKNTLANGGKREWRWSAKARPKDANGMSGGDYLKKYIKKCLLAMTDRFNNPSSIQSLYWVFNKRFFTNSRSLQAASEDSLEVSSDEEVESRFVFWKILDGCEVDTVDRMVYHRLEVTFPADPPPIQGWRLYDLNPATVQINNLKISGYKSVDFRAIQEKHMLLVSNVVAENVLSK